MALRKPTGSATRRLRRLDAPRDIRVKADAEGRPVRVARARRVLAVDRIVESWRIDDEWWRTPISRRYFTVVLEDGAHLTLYRDLTTGGPMTTGSPMTAKWYVHA